MDKFSRLLGYGRDAAQGASNAVASNVSAPVDALAWMLRKAGLPMQANPVGGSDWMAQQGLTRDPDNRLAGLAGEFAGMAGPMVAAAKAPQIARGLLQGAANLAVPRTMNPQTGAIVWHGSPHKFDKFDSTKIGTGEGAQAYGHGLYLADSNGVANNYAQTLSKTDSNGVVGTASRALTRADGDMVKAKALLQAEYAKSSPATQLHLESAISRLSEAKSANLYKVDLPDEHIAKMLDYDSTVPAEQLKPISAAAMRDFGSGATGTSGEKLYKEAVFNFKKAGHPNPTQAATDWLSAQGVPGMRYLDGGSRAGGAGSSNYVVFPGNEDMLKILERNNKAVK